MIQKLEVSKLFFYLFKTHKRNLLYIHIKGRMLIHTRNFLTLPSVQDRLHYLFLVVPLPCVTNSRYMTHTHLLDMMKSIGYTKCLHHHFSNKLAYYLFELTEKTNTRKVQWKKKVLEDGGGKNNFCVVIE